MSISKAWDWNREKSLIWLNPSEESYYIAARWEKSGYKELLDLGCGLGRHSVFFARRGFRVAALDLSVDGTDYLREWAERENLAIDARVADMLALPYPDRAFDCLFAYHVISHTDTAGIRRILKEIGRVVKPGGEIYVTLCSKQSWSFCGSGFPKIDENTVLKTDDGPEKGVPHFYTDLDGLISLFGEASLEPVTVRHTDDCYYDGQKRDTKHYFALAKKP